MIGKICGLVAKEPPQGLQDQGVAVRSGEISTIENETSKEMGEIGGGVMRSREETTMIIDNTRDRTSSAWPREHDISAALDHLTVFDFMIPEQSLQPDNLLGSNK